MFKFSVPSKTFIIGEYAVLEGGPGILIGTAPRFDAFIRENIENQESVVEGLSSHGPAMNFLKDHLDLFSRYSMKFHDPHDGKGGLGWSSAQFVLLYAIREWIVHGQNMPQIARERLLEVYLKYAWNGQGWAPSGLDVLSQLEGGILLVTAPKKFESNKLKSVILEDYHQIDAWPFAGIDFCLLRTGSKVATHAHLSSIDKIDVSKLSKFAGSASKAILNGDEDQLIECVNDFRDALSEQNLIDANAAKILHQMQSRPEVLAIKGCGALGADVILVLLVNELKSDFQDWASEEGFEIIADSSDLSIGLNIEKVHEEMDERNYEGAAK